MKKGRRFGAGVKEQILETGMRLWEENPETFNTVNVAKALGMTHGNVFYHFPTGLKNAVAQYALEKKNIKIVAQLITSGHEIVKNMDNSERAEYLAKSI
jgi:AcrR family transcriptional regulator